MFTSLISTRTQMEYDLGTLRDGRHVLSLGIYSSFLLAVPGNQVPVFRVEARWAWMRASHRACWAGVR